MGKSIEKIDLTGMSFRDKNVIASSIISKLHRIYMGETQRGDFYAAFTYNEFSDKLLQLFKEQDLELRYIIVEACDDGTHVIVEVGSNTLMFDLECDLEGKEDYRSILRSCKLVELIRTVSYIYI